MKLWGRSPFSNGQNPPPIKTNPVKEPVSTHASENPVLKSQQEEEIRMYQQRSLYYQMMQQQMLQDQQSLIRQQLQTQTSQSQPEGFNLLSPQQQQQLLLQLLISKQLQQRSSTSALDNPGSNDMQKVLSKLAAASHPPAGLWPNIPRPEPSIWDMDNRSQSEPIQQNTAAIISNIEELQRREEERKAKEQRVLEERRLAEAESLRKAEEERLELQRQEEIKRKLEMIRQEEERRKKEELLRQEEERQILEELRLHKEKVEEEQKKKENEHQRRLEELRKQEKLRKEEEQRKRDEEVQQKLRQMEEKRLLDIRKLEEKKKEELERKKELERQRAIEKQNEYERELEENRKKIQEIKNRHQSSATAWGSTTASNANAAPSLVEIRKVQEEREHRERIEKQKLMMQQQMALIQQQQQQMKNNLTWANNSQVKGQEPQIKSLAEIQKEEERVSKQQLEQAKQNKSVANNLPVKTAGVWGNSTNQLTWSSAENHKSENFTTGFWDEPNIKAPAAKKSAESAFPVLGNQSKAQKKTSNSSNKSKSRSKKEEENVLKLFEPQKTSELDDLTKWCYEVLSNRNNTVHVPTFIGFIKDVESPYEVEDYVKYFLGESKELKDFAKQYLERRSKQRNQVNNTNHEENMWGPAPAIMPNQIKVLNDESAKSNSTCKKKKKGKMQKLDNSVLGFTVHADPTRINVGEIDHVDREYLLIFVYSKL
ncbi:GRB10-interacting GYF protein 2 [Nymphon striatum]|nr:GRB10-interacting GYF protein 2 [Nymphon striatum]